MLLEKTKIKICPRCHQSFECKANDIANCQCQEVIVGGEIGEIIATLFNGCLCKNCLIQVGQKIGELK